MTYVGKENKDRPLFKGPSRRITGQNSNKKKYLSYQKLSPLENQQLKIHFLNPKDCELTIHILQLENTVHFYLLLTMSTSYCKSQGGPFSKAEGCT